MPIVFAIVVTFGLLRLVGHPFSFMSITAIPLIIGIGIDNGIHLVRRYLESARNSILDVAKASGAALIQSNLTTIVGFGALMAATFPPLAEMGLVTSVGVALTLVGGLWMIPAVDPDAEGESSAPQNVSPLSCHTRLQPRFDHPHPQKWANWRAYPLKARRSPWSLPSVATPLHT